MVRPLGPTLISRIALRLLVLAALGAALALYCLAVWHDWLPWLRGWHEYPEGWTWPTFDIPPQERFTSILVTIGAIWATILAAERISRVKWVAKRPGAVYAVIGAFFALMIVLGVTLQMGLLGLKANNANALLFQRITSRHFTSYFSFGADTPSLQPLFSGYLHSITNCLHCQGHPPGPSFFYWVDAQVVSLLPEDWRHNLAASVWSSLGDDPRVISLKLSLNDTLTVSAYAGGLAMLLAASAIVVPLFGLARRLGPPGYEFRLAGLGLALPGLMLMSPEFDQVYATVTVVAMYLGLCGLSGLRLPWRWDWHRLGPIAGMLKRAQRRRPRGCLLQGRGWRSVWVCLCRGAWRSCWYRWVCCASRGCSARGGCSLAPLPA